MSEQSLLVVAGAAGLVLVALLLMGGLHEKHYKDRRGIIRAAHLEGIEARLTAVEAILTEDRLT